ncbi:hypothetical protein KDL44_00585 [bacterium]|nr:hypothetical protein [bacterium]
MSNDESGRPSIESNVNLPNPIAFYLIFYFIIPLSIGDSIFRESLVLIGQANLSQLQDLAAIIRPLIVAIHGLLFIILEGSIIYFLRFGVRDFSLGEFLKASTISLYARTVTIITATLLNYFGLMPDYQLPQFEASVFEYVAQVSIWIATFYIYFLFHSLVIFWYCSFDDKVSPSFWIQRKLGWLLLVVSFASVLLLHFGAEQYVIKIRDKVVNTVGTSDHELENKSVGP